ncbi:MAG: YidC/Oxa1 family insertase periplasmic-domain containing protein, partial [Candidatus Omnitrophica bacterium]|nr:YidC/Oxa1 family insertase periplasmic-domain containing protein [Candidatus Omnitrophota bacterium]
NNTNNIKYELDNGYFVATFTNIGAKLESLFIKAENVHPPLVDFSSFDKFTLIPFSLKRQTANEIVFVARLDNIEIIKTFSVEGQYVIKSAIQVTNNSDKRISFGGNVKAFRIDVSHETLKKKGYFDNANASRNGMLNEYAIKIGNKIIRKNNANVFKDKHNKSEMLENVEWIAFRDRHFCSIVKPLDPVKGYQTSVNSEKMLDLYFLNDNPSIDPGAELRFGTEIFIGPQEVDVLKKFGSFRDIVSYKIGGFFDIFALGLGDPAAKGILILLKIIKNLIHSWGFSIIIVALFICGITYPLTLKSMRSMKKVQAFQPEMAKIKEKHKNNPQKMNQEMMEFYKKHKINPLGGCLPMFFQMPLFYGVIQLLWRYVGFRGESFLWIKDLSEPDRLFILSVNLPVLGNEINILPIIVFVLAIFQQKFSGKNVNVSDPNQALQMKMMRIMFPAMIILFFYRFASAMALYFTIYYSFSTFTQWKMSKEQNVVVS